MSHIGIGGNLIQPNKQCLSCGDEVYWKIPKDLPKMTKLMIDGKALYIHRANFQIIDTALLD